MIRAFFGGCCLGIVVLIGIVILVGSIAALIR